IGAIGIARTFQFSGHFGEPMWTETKFSNEELHTSLVEELDNSAIKHFYEKLFKLKDLMHTPTAKKLAEERHQFMIQYLKQFMSEWNFNKE
ncbi:HD domain-containing protein, partial [Staphylococcus epidermidis]|nr:HD domain-containing protein [Staphylococcus epidermidis]